MGKKLWSTRYEHEKKMEELKYYICEVIRRIAFARRWEQREMSMMFGIAEASLSRVLRYRVEKLTLSQLFKYLVMIDPHFQILISNYTDISDPGEDRRLRDAVTSRFRE